MNHSRDRRRVCTARSNAPRSVRDAYVRGLAKGALLMAVLAGSTPAFAQEAPGPAEITAAVARLRADVEKMRFVMGAPVAAADWEVTQAAPRHVLSTAQTLFARVGRLANEVAGDPLVVPQTPAEINSAAALEVVMAAHGHLLDLMRRVGVQPAPAASAPANATLADALVAMVDANRQLNAMLVYEYLHADLFGVVLESVRYASGIADAPIPPLPRLQPGVTPTAVYQSLLDCYELTRQAKARRNMRALGLNLRRERRREDVPPSEAYDLSRLLLADIAGMARRFEAQPNPEPVIARPAFVYSAHTHRLVRVLADLLRTTGQ